jgi:hypothetical protein
MGQNNGKQMEYNEVKFEKYTDRDLVAHRLSNFKIIRVDELDPILIRAKMLEDPYFIDGCLTTNRYYDSVNEMINYYLNHKDVEIYKQTKYCCNITTNICICNLNATNKLKEYDIINIIYVSWGEEC